MYICNYLIRDFLLHRFFTIIGLLILTSCSTFYNVNTTNSIKYTKPTTIEQNFDISGRFFVQNLNKTEYGNFTWLKTKDKEEIDFNTPLGQVVAKIIIESTSVTLYTKDKKYSGDDLDSIMQNNLGFMLPFNYLHYWVQGVSLPNEPIEKQNNNGFNQLGWKVEYIDWYDNNHPKVIKLSNGDLQIKLFIEW